MNALSKRTLARLLAVTCLGGALVLLWSTSPPVERHETAVAPLAEPLAERVPAQPNESPPGKVTHQSADDFAAYARWREIEATHRNRPQAEPRWAESATTELQRYIDAVNKAVAAAPGYEHLSAKILAVDCRKGSCTTALQFARFETAKAFVEMFKEGRFQHTLHQQLNFECPLRNTAFPRVPGTTQENFPVLLHFDCGA